ncbi:MAG: hypothetical protein ACFFDT_32790 [Candidatus Hodarchaeota archaeon]
MQRRQFIFLAFLVSIFPVALVSTIESHLIVAAMRNPHVQNEVIGFQIATRILDIFQNNRTAKVKISLSFIDFPYNATQVNAVVNGTGGTEVRFQCTSNGDHLYSAESNITTWRLTGFGESYPFDSYRMYFNLIPESVHFLSGNSSYRIGSNDVFDIIGGGMQIPDHESRFFEDAWWISTSAHSATSFIVNVQRNWQRARDKLPISYSKQN